MNGTVPPDTVRVPVLPSQVHSKINWTQWISAGAMILTLVSGGVIDITPQEQLAVATVISLGTNIVTWIMRTYFTKSVIPQSL